MKILWIDICAIQINKIINYLLLNCLEGHDESESKLLVIRLLSMLHVTCRTTWHPKTTHDLSLVVRQCHFTRFYDEPISWLRTDRHDKLLTVTLTTDYSCDLIFNFLAIYYC